MTCTDLVFDLYGTLVDIHTEESDGVWEKTALYLGYHGVHMSGNALHAAFDAAMRKREARAGQSYECFPDIPFERVLAEVIREEAGENADDLAFHAAQLFRVCSTDYIRLYDGVIEALRSLRNAGFRLWLLSNAQRVFTAYELAHLQLIAPFDGVFISSDYQCRKPDQRFFRALIREQKLQPERCLMIGNDRSTDIAGAKEAGFATLYMHTKLTPDSQAEADPSLHPDCAPAACRHFEFEGDDWHELAPLIRRIAVTSR